MTAPAPSYHIDVIRNLPSTETTPGSIAVQITASSLLKDIEAFQFYQFHLEGRERLKSALRAGGLPISILLTPAFAAFYAGYTEYVANIMHEAAQAASLAAQSTPETITFAITILHTSDDVTIEITDAYAPFLLPAKPELSVPGTMISYRTILNAEDASIASIQSHKHADRKPDGPVTVGGQGLGLALTHRLLDVFERYKEIAAQMEIRAVDEQKAAPPERPRRADLEVGTNELGHATIRLTSPHRYAREEVIAIAATAAKLDFEDPVRPSLYAWVEEQNFGSVERLTAPPPVELVRTDLGALGPGSLFAKRAARAAAANAVVRGIQQPNARLTHEAPTDTPANPTADASVVVPTGSTSIGLGGATKR